ncbi:MAG: thiamine pyrophosphate-requiring protein [SAR202 cluster bacterium]|nr:MAG: thiamine pyrophosphate-requiring protein [SAR202 cluster bacterium]MCH2672254.1 thiamine pyrophosphate-requiring protein [Dehalococcoidia bacterium]
MNTIEAITEILKREGVQYLPCFPTTPVIEAAALGGIRPIICRQERVGVGIADGLSRVSNGDHMGVFAMQYGPGAENAYPGIATSYSDSVPILLLPLGHPRDKAGINPHYDSLKGYADITKAIEQVNMPDRTSDIMRRAFAGLRQGRGGPMAVEIPADIALEEVREESFYYAPSRPTTSQGNPSDIEAAAKALCAAHYPVIMAGQGVLYAKASDELLELAELLQVPVCSTLLGKSAFPEVHPLALGSTGPTISGHAYHFIRRSDLIFGIGTSFTKHGMVMNIPPGKTLMQATNDASDINKDYNVDLPIVGDAKLVLRQLIDSCKEIVGNSRKDDQSTAKEVQSEREGWLAQWRAKLSDSSTPMTPYRVIWDFMHTIPPEDAIVTHDSGSPRDQLTPFYRSNGPRTYLGWGKSHGLGTGLGLTIGAKLAAPEKVCVNFMGDAAFGMVGLDFETAVRSNIPIITVVLNNSSMAVETKQMADSHNLYGTRDLGGNYADLGKAMGGYAERVTDPNQISAAFTRARKVTEEEGKAVLLEFITNEEVEFSHRRPF